tara:strand:- start:2530 stop:3570 length:1041 start_codon:yes stop_codon:yes gene_type:complete
MQNLKDFGLNKSQIGRLSGVSATTIRNYVEDLCIQPINQQKKIPKYSLSSCRKILKKAVSEKYPIKNKIHTFFNFKGGVGKTTFAYQVSSIFALLGYEVLVIDTDPQHNLTTAFGAYNDSDTGNLLSESEISEMRTLYDVIAHNYPIRSSIIPVFEGLSLIPSSLALTRLDQELFTTTRREEQFKDLLTPLKNNYDLIILDANPSISNTNLNAINAADVINIVAELQIFSLSSTNMLLTELEEFFIKKMKKKLPILNIIPNKYNLKDVSSLKAAAALSEAYSDLIRPNFYVRQSADFNRSSAEKIPLIFMSNKNSNALKDTIEIVDEILYVSCDKRDRLPTKESYL